MLHFFYYSKITNGSTVARLGYLSVFGFAVIKFVIVSSEWNVKRDKAVVHGLFDGNQQLMVLFLTNTGF